MLNDSNIGIIANLTLVNHKSIGNSQQNLQFVASTFSKTNNFNRMSSYDNETSAWFLGQFTVTKKEIYIIRAVSGVKGWMLNSIQI